MASNSINSYSTSLLHAPFAELSLQLAWIGHGEFYRHAIQYAYKAYFIFLFVFVGSVIWDYSAIAMHEISNVILFQTCKIISLTKSEPQHSIFKILVKFGQFQPHAIFL